MLFLFIVVLKWGTPTSLIHRRVNLEGGSRPSSHIPGQFTRRGPLPGTPKKQNSKIGIFEILTGTGLQVDSRTYDNGISLYIYIMTGEGGCTLNDTSFTNLKN